MSNNQVAVSPAKTLNDFMDKYKGQIALALPKHITADRMVRLAMTAFSQNKGLQDCDMHSIFASVVVAAQLGLEIGVGGQGYLVPYKGKATFVPGWQGLVDLVSRAGRATVWTGAVYQGDEFDWALGDKPFVTHRPGGDGDSWKDITHVYAIGRVNGSDYPVIEVWTMDRIVRHLKKFNKVGGMHYALKDNGQNMEMYARKVALLQVLKYMPKSVEVQRAVDVANVADTGKSFTFDGEVVTVKDIEEQGNTVVDQETGEVTNTLPVCTEAEFKKNTTAWRQQIVEKTKTVAELVAFIQTRTMLTEEQKLTIDSWAHEE
jgi:recombination protein RecT